MNNKFKAIVLNQSGDRFSREIKTLDKSFFKSGDVLVKVDYSGLNYKDALILKNGGKLVKEYPHIPGIDFSGKVIESDTSDFKSGDDVVLTGCRVGEIYPGGYSQLVKVKSELLVKNYFLKADVITTISFKVKKDISKLYNKKIHVIYNPIKDVYFDENIKKNNIFFYVGRASDPVKRFNLVRESLLKIKDGVKNTKICGSQNPNFGDYLGIIKDQELNKLYNASKYVLLPSSAEGIGLPMIEGMICGAIPITCSDNLTAREFSPPDFICEPYPQSIVNKIEELNKEYEAKRKIALEFGKKYKIQFDKKNIAKNIINIFNLAKK